MLPVFRRCWYLFCWDISLRCGSSENQTLNKGSGLRRQFREKAVRAQPGGGMAFLYSVEAVALPCFNKPQAVAYACHCVALGKWAQEDRKFSEHRR